MDAAGIFEMQRAGGNMVHLQCSAISEPCGLIIVNAN